MLIVSKGKYLRVDGACNPSERGLISVLLVAVVLPLIGIMLTLSLELAHFFGIRDELQRVVDREAHDSLVFSRSGEQIEATVRARMAAISGMATISEVRLERSRARSEVSASARYSGAFFHFISDIMGSERTVMPMFVRAQVRIQPSASLIVLDRRVVSTSDECNDAGLGAMQTFVDRIANTWVNLGNTTVSVAVSPGPSEPVELLSASTIDRIPRCRAPTSDSPFDAGAVRGASMPVVFDAMDFALQVNEHANTRVFSASADVRSVVIILSRQSYDQGYSSAAHDMLRNTGQQLAVPLDVISVVLDDTRSIDVRPMMRGGNGNVYREVGASASELRGIRLANAIVRNTSDRIVLER
jgi:hypothetical protein